MNRRNRPEAIRDQKKVEDLPRDVSVRGDDYAAYIRHTINKVANWMVNADSQKCVLALDPPYVHPGSKLISEKRKNQLAASLANDAMRNLMKHVNNNHNDKSGRKLRSADDQSSDFSKSHNSTAENRNVNNRHGAVDEVRRSSHRERNYGESTSKHKSSAKREQSSKSNRRDTGDNAEVKEDRYLERIISRATEEIRTAVYKLKADNKLPDSCHLKMKLSIKPQKQKASGSNSKSGRHDDNSDDKGGASRDKKKHYNDSRQKSSSRQSKHEKPRPSPPEYRHHEQKVSSRRK